jgi:hypothetical protein
MPQQEKQKHTIEHLYELLYAYRFGTISFVDLVERMEAVLCLPSAQTRRDAPVARAEMHDDD